MRKKVTYYNPELVQVQKTTYINGELMRVWEVKYTEGELMWVLEVKYISLGSMWSKNKTSAHSISILAQERKWEEKMTPLQKRLRSYRLWNMNN